MAGRLVVIEGADGAGGEEQSRRLLVLLKERGIPAKRHQYPDYSGPIGRIIHDFLHKKYDFSPEMLLLLYGADMVKDVGKIHAWLKQDKVVILDRYFTSALAYQSMQGVKLENCLKFIGNNHPSLLTCLHLIAVQQLNEFQLSTLLPCASFSVFQKANT